MSALGRARWQWEGRALRGSPFFFGATICSVNTPHPTLIAFEQHLGLGPTSACRMLGISYVTYAHYRNGSRELPGYHVVHIETIKILTKPQLARRIEELLHDR